jgi:hypothetical protein
MRSYGSDLSAPRILVSVPTPASVVSVRLLRTVSSESSTDIVRGTRACARRTGHPWGARRSSEDAIQHVIKNQAASDHLRLIAISADRMHIGIRTGTALEGMTGAGLTAADTSESVARLVLTAHIRLSAYPANRTPTTTSPVVAHVSSVGNPSRTARIIAGSERRPAMRASVH